VATVENSAIYGCSIEEERLAGEIIMDDPI